MLSVSGLRRVAALSKRNVRCFSSEVLDLVNPQVGLTEDQRQFYSLAKDFADAEMAPHASKWDAEHFFPEDALRGAASLGFGAMYCNEEYGGTALSRMEGIPVIEALSSACTSTTAYLTIHNMVRSRSCRNHGLFTTNIIACLSCTDNTHPLIDFCVFCRLLG